SVALTFAAWDGRPAHEQIPPLVRLAVLQLTGHARWKTEVPLLSCTVEDAERQPVLPPFLAGLTILDAGPAVWCRSTSAAGLAVAAPLTTHHDTLVTVTVPARRPRRGQRTKHAAADPAAEILLDQLRLLADRLEAADIAVEGPLSPVQTAEALRLRCDPALGA